MGDGSFGAVCAVIVIIVVIIIIIAAFCSRRDGRRDWDRLEDDFSRGLSDLDVWDSRHHRHGRNHSSRRSGSSSSRDFDESRRISSRIHFLDESSGDCSPEVHRIKDTVRFRRHESHPCSPSSSSSSTCSPSSSSSSSCSPHCKCERCVSESYSPRRSKDSSSSASWHH